MQCSKDVQRRVTRSEDIMASGPDKPKDSAEQAYAAAAAAKARPARVSPPAKPAPAKKPGAARKVAKPVTRPTPEVAAPVVPVAEAPESLHQSSLRHNCLTRLGGRRKLVRFPWRARLARGKGRPRGGPPWFFEN